MASDTATAASITDTTVATAAPAVPDGVHVAEDAATKAGVVGNAHVRNNCNFPVYVYVCGQHPATCGAEKTLAPHTGTYSEKYSYANNGRSIKIGRKAGEVAKPILQFEYTNTGTGQVSYDLSDFNGNPFGPFGFTLTSSNAQCFHKHCPAPGSHKVCPFVFTTATNGHVSDCPLGDDLGVTLCG